LTARECPDSALFRSEKSSDTEITYSKKTGFSDLPRAADGPAFAPVVDKSKRLLMNALRVERGMAMIPVGAKGFALMTGRSIVIGCRGLRMNLGHARHAADAGAATGRIAMAAGPEGARA
jgi:hypothetical protein